MPIPNKDAEEGEELMGQGIQHTKIEYKRERFVGQKRKIHRLQPGLAHFLLRLLQK